jgi:hypothetical protein
MKLLFSLVSGCLLLVACSGQREKDTSVLVKLNDKILTKEDLEVSVPQGLTAEDSTIVAEHYIRIWINDNLKYAMANKNIANKEYIERLVEDYRKSLTIYQYEEQLINEKLSREIADQSLLNYYEAHKENFKTDQPLIKGLFLKIPLNAPQIDKIRSWYKALTPTNLNNIKDYCIRNVAVYGDYVENWKSFNEIMENFPGSVRPDPAIITQNKYLERQDDNYYYFLNVIAYLLPDDNAPFEYAKPTVKEILINQQKIDFLKQVEEDLYNKALNSGQIVFYNEE